MVNLQSIYFGQRHKDFDRRDYDIIKKVKRLYLRYHRQAENSCNGYGVVKGQMYYTGMSYGQQAGDYEKREYGLNVKSAYFEDNEETIFDKEMDILSTKIEKIVYQFNFDKYALWKVKPFRLEFQGDPRGYTVKLYYNNEIIEW